MRTFNPILLLIFLTSAIFSGAQKPPETAPPTSQAPSAAPPPAAPDTKSYSSSTNKKKPLPGFVILGTVFNDKALSFPNVLVRVRRTDEKKFRWETYTNSRGEFAVRIPEGQNYVVLVQAKNYQQQSQTVTTNSGEIQQRLSIKLVPAKPEKATVKP